MSKILVVDDDPHIRELVRVFLRNEGFDVYEAADGLEALARLESVKADLVILDVMMPNLDGWELARQLSEAGRFSVPLLMLTARGETSQKIKGFGLGVDDYLVKPFEPLAGAALEVWQSDSEGRYDVQMPPRPDSRLDGSALRGVFHTGADGGFHFETIKPAYYPVPTDGPVGDLLCATGRHPFRPAHIHFIVSAAGYQPLTTELFDAADPYLDSDAVFGVRQSLIVPFVKRAGGWAVEFDFKMQP